MWGTNVNQLIVKEKKDVENPESWRRLTQLAGGILGHDDSQSKK